MALGEHFTHRRETGHLLFIEIGTGSGCGIVAGGREQLLAGVRERTLPRSLPLATGALRIVPSQLGDRAGLIGAAVLVIEHVLAPDEIDRAIEVGTAGAQVR